MYYDERGLDKYVSAQARDYDDALREIRGGRKRSHWIWYIFPQLEGLGYSCTAQYYAIRGREEAEAYMEDPVLSKRLIEISKALLELDSDDPTEVMGYPDDLKLRSSMTLFSMVSDDPVFKKVLDKFYGGEECSYTREYLR